MDIKPQLQAELLKLRVQIVKALANDIRLRIIDALKAGEQSSGDLARALKLPAATLSQHLTTLRTVGVLDSRRQGQQVLYRLSDPRIVQACDLMYSALLSRLRHMEKLSKQVHRGRQGFPKERA